MNRYKMPPADYHNLTANEVGAISFSPDTSPPLHKVYEGMEYYQRVFFNDLPVGFISDIADGDYIYTAPLCHRTKFTGELDKLKMFLRRHYHPYDWRWAYERGDGTVAEAVVEVGDIEGLLPELR